MSRIGVAMLLAASMIVSACMESPRADAASAVTKNYGAAPEFSGIDRWLNSAPLSLESLRGNVVLVEFWTYTCSNCLRTLPHVNAWYEQYKDKGFVVVGVHTPETTQERDTDSVKRAIERHAIKFPVAQDNDYATWNAYQNKYWPASYLIDRSGAIVRKHIGEGDYEEMDLAIQSLLKNDAH